MRDPSKPGPDGGRAFACPGGYRFELPTVPDHATILGVGREQWPDATTRDTKGGFPVDDTTTLEIAGALAAHTLDEYGNVEMTFGDDGTICTGCGDLIEEYADGWRGEDDGETVCPDLGTHNPGRIPLSWCNSAGIHPEPDGDSITVTLSVADPRGAFCMSIRRTEDGRLLLHVPHPDEGWLHAPLAPVHPGTYAVGA